MGKGQLVRRAGGWVSALGVGVLAAMLGGCQVWNSTLDFLKWKDPAAKNEGPVQKNPLIRTPPSPTPPAASMMIPRVTVLCITVPVGSFSTNEKIWAQLNEDAIDSRTTVLMAQNGLRAATGASSRWPAIKNLLDAPGATTDQRDVQTDGRLSVNVVTRPNVIDQIVVSVDRDLQQQGRTFERCDNGFRLSMRGNRTKPELLVQLEPIVTLGTVQVARTGSELGVSRGGGFTSEEAFEDLRMSATLTADQFLVISAMDPKSSPFSVGTQWLSDQERVPAVETVLIFVPASAPASASAGR